MRAVLVATAVLFLAGCGSSGTEEPVVPAPEGGEPSNPEEMKMPTAEEAAAAAAAAQAEAESGVVYADAGENGGKVSLKTGETLRIELQSIPTAGYVWTVVEAPAFMEAVSEYTRPTDPAHQNLPGFTGGNHYLAFDYLAKSAGTGTFRLTEGRPWETEEEPMDTYELTVTVTE